MIPNTKQLLELLLEFVKVEYQRSRQDRQHLHEEEWQAGEQAPSILGETEVRADAVIGVVRGYLFSQNFDTKSAREILHRYSVYDSKVLMSWLLKHTESRTQFVAYLHAIEHLRRVALDSFDEADELDQVRTATFGDSYIDKPIRTVL
jgi:hypothetical protein